jgi:hypothetical protein
MRGTIGGAVLALVAVHVSHLAPAAAQSPVRVVVTFTEVRTGSQGNESRSVRIEGQLLGGNRVADLDQRPRVGGGGGGRKGGGGGGGRGRREGASRPNEATFGAGVQPFEGRGTTATWRVGTNNTLVRTLSHRNDIETTTIALTGDKACRATVTYRLKPGRTIYVRSGGRNSFSDVRADNVTCSISD